MRGAVSPGPTQRPAWAFSNLLGTGKFAAGGAGEAEEGSAGSGERQAEEETGGQGTTEMQGGGAAHGVEAGQAGGRGWRQVQVLILISTGTFLPHAPFS